MLMKSLHVNEIYIHITFHYIYIIRQAATTDLDNQQE